MFRKDGPTQEEVNSKIEKILKQPISTEKISDAEKTRRNLLVISLISIAFVLVGISQALPTINGVKMQLTKESMSLGLVSINFYFLLHHCLFCYESYKTWEIRITGKNGLKSVGTFSNGFLDDITEPQQSTLYSWWVEKAINLKEVSFEIDNVINKLKILIEENKSDNKKDEIENQIDRLSKIKDLKKIYNILESSRIKISLENFDKAFIKALSFQEIRWWLMDIFFPITLGFISIYGLIYTNYASWIKYFKKFGSIYYPILISLGITLVLFFLYRFYKKIIYFNIKE